MSAARSRAVAWVGRTLQQQVDFLPYIDVFWTRAIVAVLMILRPIDLRARRGGIETRPSPLKRAERSDCPCGRTLDASLQGLLAMTVERGPLASLTRPLPSVPDLHARACLDLRDGDQSVRREMVTASQNCG
ncbi:MAG: hypothetical protein C5B56_08945 [Proteobacteria bacterium]|nr:MAG: hypothetical protein C5B56_08945 [Pseudomonadota bacterium]